VAYYLPPQLWAWAPWRIRKVHQYVDLVLSGLPFEADWYAQRGAKVLYVGHPFFDAVARHPLDAAFLKEWAPESGATVAVLPGSRGHEVSSCWPLLLEAVRRLAEQHPETQFLVANYKESHRAYCRDLYQKSELQLPISFFVGKTSEIVELADCAMMVSGSVSLELLARGTPATVLYRCSRLMYWVGRMLVTCRFMSLPNLIAGRMVMPERLSVGQPEPAVAELVDDVDRWLSNPAALDSARAELDALRRQIFATGATERVAEVLLSRLPAVATERVAA
jgi:lipid-A-disaccharide synthase